MALSILPGQSGVDFASARPDPALMKQRGVAWIDRYLTETAGGLDKAMERAECEACWQLGIGVGLLGETSATAALEGAARGTADGKLYVAAAQALKAPPGTSIVACHDTGTWTANVVPYFLACFQVFADAGYTNGVYGSKQCVQALINAGVVLDRIVAPNAVGWGGGRHPLAQVWQGPRRASKSYAFDEIAWLESKGWHLADASGMGNVDMNIAVLSFNVWLPGSGSSFTAGPAITPASPPAPTSTKDSAMRIVFTTDNLGIWLINGNSIKQLSPEEFDAVSHAQIPSNGADPAGWVNAGQLAVLKALFPGDPAAGPFGSLTLTGQFTGTAS